MIKKKRKAPPVPVTLSALDLTVLALVDRVKVLEVQVAAGRVLLDELKKFDQYIYNAVKLHEDQHHHPATREEAHDARQR